MNITTDVQTFEEKGHCPLDTREALIDEVWSGLRKRPRSLVPWMLYDSEGSRLFECITTLPEYYPTRTERGAVAVASAQNAAVEDRLIEANRPADIGDLYAVH